MVPRDSLFSQDSHYFATDTEIHYSHINTYFALGVVTHDQHLPFVTLSYKSVLKAVR